MNWNRRALRWGLVTVLAVMMSGCVVVPMGHARGGYYYPGAYVQGGVSVDVHHTWR